MVYCVGLTGTVASGKSTAAAYFSSVGITIINTDTLAKELALNGQPAFDEIKKHFGTSILTADGELNRPALRKRITQNSHERQWLESCLPPRIRQAISEAILHVKSPYCIIEIPLLTQRTDYPYLNRVLLIESTRERQTKRIMQRDSCTRMEAEALLGTQPHRTTHRSLADDRVTNNRSPQDFILKLTHLHQQYLTDQLSEKLAC